MNTHPFSFSSYNRILINLIESRSFPLLFYLFYRVDISCVPLYYVLYCSPPPPPLPYPLGHLLTLHTTPPSLPFPPFLAPRLCLSSCRAAIHITLPCCHTTLAIPSLLPQPPPPSYKDHTIHTDPQPQNSKSYSLLISGSCRYSSMLPSMILYFSLPSWDLALDWQSVGGLLSNHKRRG